MILLSYTSFPPASRMELKKSIKWSFTDIVGKKNRFEKASPLVFVMKIKVKNRLIKKNVKKKITKILSLNIFVLFFSNLLFGCFIFILSECIFHIIHHSFCFVKIKRK